MSGQSRAVRCAELVVAAVERRLFLTREAKTEIANAVIDAVGPLENELAAVRAWPKPYRPPAETEPDINPARFGDGS